MDAERVRRAWSHLVGVPESALEEHGIVVVERNDSDAVVVVTMEPACVVAAPPLAAQVLRRLTRADLADAVSIASKLSDDLRCSPIGTADLWYTETPPTTGIARTEAADVGTVAHVRSGCDNQEWDESGLAEMPYRWVAMTAGGSAAAVAGYQLWGSDIAHLGVLTHREFRSQGYAREAATRAVTEALRARLLAQWRSRTGNEPSSRLARRLGFTWMGRQSAVVVDSPNAPTP